MKLLWKLGKAAARYRSLYVMAIVSTLGLTLVSLAVPRILASLTALIGQGDTASARRLIAIWTAVLVGLLLVRILFRFGSSYFSHKAAWNLVEQLRVRVYGHIQTLSLAFFSSRQTGELMSHVVNDTANFELLYAHIIPEMVTNLVTVLGIVVILLVLNWKLALLTLLPVPLILGAGWLYATRVRPNFTVAQNALSDLNARLQDQFSGIREIQAFGREASATEAVTAQANVFTRSMLHALKLNAVFHPSVEFLSSVGSVVVVGAGALLVFGGELAAADIVAFLLYLGLLYTPIAGLARLLEDTQHAYAGAERVAAILDTPPGIVDRPGVNPIGPVQGAITFEGVSFAYEKGTKVLDDIDFSCHGGQMVALVGPTGVGKTTLAQLVSRFYEPTEGRILIDGHDIAGVTLASLRASIAPVLQDTFLFNGTIAENIGIADPAASREQIVAAAKAACIHESILAMPQQYDTVTGERGVRLSGGQKQRIAIARAILRQAPIVILDEATASVDLETEREIQTAIAGLAGSRTIIAIAHRLSTIRNADLILVLENGQIVQRGTHAELIAQPGLYRRLNESQESMLSLGRLADSLPEDDRA